MKMAARVLALLALAVGSVAAGCDGGGTEHGGGARDGGAPDAAAPDAAAPAGSFLGGAGIGVSDLEASLTFYTQVIGMTLRYELPVPGYVDERVLYFEESKGSDLVLMNYIDGQQRNYTRNPVKLVFYVPSAVQHIDAIRAQGLEVLAEPAAQAAFGGVVVGFARDPDGYVLEIVEDDTLEVPYLGAIGIGVSDLEQSRDFYTRVLGMQTMGDLIRVPGVWDELILTHASGKGSAVVLLHYTDRSTRNYTNVPVKLAHFVPDSAVKAADIEREGLSILAAPAEYTVQGTDVLIALARDPDGYVLELITPQ